MGLLLSIRRGAGHIEATLLAVLFRRLPPSLAGEGKVGAAGEADR
jgi:hypothetical protein